MEKLLLTDTVKNLLTYSKIQTDHGVFRLHYKLTATLLFIGSVLVTATQFFGDPIYCVSNDIISAAIMNNYCWVEGTITLPRALNRAKDETVASPGVDQRKITENEPVLEHAYYQWVWLFLLFQSVAFYFPRWLWRCFEQGRMKRLINELVGSGDKGKVPILSKKDWEAKAEAINKYFVSHRFEYQRYAYHFFACEFLALVNVILQIYLLDRFLGYQFWTYGPDVISYLTQDPENRIDPMARVFPKMSKCRLRRFGTSGEIQIHDAICLLGLNVVNEKIFVFLWFWFVALTIISFFNILYRVLMLSTKSYRSIQIKTFASLIEKDDLDKIKQNGTCGDWFVLSLLKDNVKAHHFKEVVTSLSSSEFKEKRPPLNKSRSKQGV